jgi:hypothetical protein
MFQKLPAAAMSVALFVVLSLAATSCGDGGGGGGGVGPNDPGTINDVLSPVDPAALSQEDRIYFLKRTHFAFRETELATLNQLGYSGYLDWMLNMQLDPLLEADALAATVPDADFPSAAELSRWWLYLMVHNPNGFQERLGLFWHDHFAASTEVLDAQSRFWYFDHVNLWRTQGTAIMSDLLYSMSTDWTMLRWLDGYVSTKNAPNENFAREFWELFTLGADNGYTQGDIVEASRAFTGYRRILVADRAGPGRDQYVMQFDMTRHDNTDKTIFGLNFGANGQQEYRDMVDFTLANRPVAEFLCKKIWEEFVYENPDYQLMFQLASRFRSTGYDLRDLFKTIFMSKEFFSTKARTGLIKSPIEHDIGFIRATGLEITPNRIDSNVTALGQRPTQPPTVNGWPAGFYWLSSQAIVDRANFLRDCVYYRNEAPQVGFDVGTLVVPGEDTDAEVVDRFAYLLQVTLTAPQRDECILYLNSDRNASGNFSQPWDFTNAVQKEKKLRGLPYILAQHPTYQLR